MFHISVNFSLHVPFTSCFLAVCGWGHMWSHRNEFPLGTPNCSSLQLRSLPTNKTLVLDLDTIWSHVLLIHLIHGDHHFPHDCFNTLYVHKLFTYCPSSILHLFFVSVCFLLNIDFCRCWQQRWQQRARRRTHANRLIDQSWESLGKFSSSMQQPTSKSW